MLSLSDAQLQDKYCDDFFPKSDQIASEDRRRDSEDVNTESQVHRGIWRVRTEDFALQTSPGSQLCDLRTPLQWLRVPPADNYQASWLYLNILPTDRHLICLGKKVDSMLRIKVELNSP